ncbi:dihydropteroate synthase [Sphaerotilus microaerophilus]|jgi:dihydropteroate synthase|uniref:Dihydropteroate synthase n=1 Tax=Sphaerotilus microaerophilus TaxID=2914710 RepID=A0ABM7YQ53_9BURK|nr:dihydropteroate synthase [Sphaerotilus sp. FB-5]BDI06665.1 dihydropteroate synthase [Sphaerotilus sp. FB-5]
MYWKTTRFEIPLDAPRVMGIVNVTPDSFSDGGRGAREAIAHAEALLRDGAHILDIGGESSRPGAAPVGLEEELARVLPVLREALRLGVPVSVDTYKAEVMRAALDLGVDIINDIAALRATGAVEVVASHPACGVCLMHMRGEPRSMQQDTHYDDVVGEVRSFLAQRCDLLRAAGVAPARIVLDPGIGFGKSVADNFALLPGQGALRGLGFPVLAGWSRKSAIGSVTGRATEERMVGSVAAALAAVQYGARVIRVHDVAATVDALAVWQAAGLPAATA